MINFIRLIDRVVSPYALLTNAFISCWLFAALVSTATKLRASEIATAGRGSNDWLSWRRHWPSVWCVRKTCSVTSLHLWLAYILYFSAAPLCTYCWPIQYYKIQVWFWLHSVHCCLPGTLLPACYAKAFLLRCQPVSMPLACPYTSGLPFCHHHRHCHCPVIVHRLSLRSFYNSLYIIGLLHHQKYVCISMWSYVNLFISAINMLLHSYTPVQSSDDPDCCKILLVWDQLQFPACPTHITSPIPTGRCYQYGGRGHTAPKYK